MSAADIILVLLGFLQIGIVGFFTYWIKRIHSIEDMVAENREQRTEMQLQFERRVSTLEAKLEQVLDGLDELKHILNNKKTR